MAGLDGRESVKLPGAVLIFLVIGIYLISTGNGDVVKGWGMWVLICAGLAGGALLIGVLLPKSESHFTAPKVVEKKKITEEKKLITEEAKKNSRSGSSI